MPFSHVIFDLDGTLLNTIDDLAGACNHVCARHGWPTFSVDDYRLKVGNGMAKLVERIIPQQALHTPGIHEQALNEFRAYYNLHSTDATRPYPHTHAMLDTFNQHGICCAVLTNKDHGAAESLIKQFFDADHFALVQGRIDAFPPKPAAPLTRHVLDRLGADPNQTLFVGDSAVDIACAHNANLAACGVTWGFRGAQELTDAGADYLAATWDDLIELVLNNARPCDAAH